MITARKIILSLATVWATLMLSAYLQALAGASLGQDRLVSVAHLRADSPAVTLSDLRTAHFTPTDPNFLGGYDTAPHWFRLILAPPPRGGETVFQLSANLIDRVTLYLPGKTGFTVKENGDHVPFARREAKLLPLSFLIPPESLGKPIYLRVQSTSSLRFTFGATDLATAERHAARLMTLHVIYFSLLGMGIALSAHRLRLTPDRLSLALLAFTTVYFVYSAEVLGYAQVCITFADPHLHSRLTEICTVLTVVTSILFQRFFLNQFAPYRPAIRASDALACAAALLLVPMIGGSDPRIGTTLMVISLAALCLAPVMVATLRIDHPVARRALYAGYTAWFLVTGAWIVSCLGLFEIPTLSRPYVEVFGLNSLFIILLVMAIDRAESQHRNRRTQLSLRNARIRAEANARNAAMQDGFMHMLVHEMRNNLSVLQMTLPDIAAADTRDRLATTIRALDTSLVEARHAMWLSQGNWPVVPRPLPLVDALAAVIDNSPASDRITLDGDDADATITADPAMLAAALSGALEALVALSPPDAPIRIELVQNAADAPCTLSCETGPATTAEAAAAFPLVTLILRQMGGNLRITPTAPDSIRIEIQLPNHPSAQIDRAPAA